MSSDSKESPQEQTQNEKNDSTVQYNEKQNTIAYNGKLYVNSSWKTWCWVLLIIFIIIPAGVAIISLFAAKIFIGSAVNQIKESVEGSSSGN